MMFAPAVCRFDSAPSDKYDSVCVSIPPPMGETKQA